MSLKKITLNNDVKYVPNYKIISTFSTNIAHITNYSTTTYFCKTNRPEITLTLYLTIF